MKKKCSDWFSCDFAWFIDLLICCWRDRGKWPLRNQCARGRGDEITFNERIEEWETTICDDENDDSDDLCEEDFWRERIESARVCVCGLVEGGINQIDFLFLQSINLSTHQSIIKQKESLSKRTQKTSKSSLHDRITWSENIIENWYIHCLINLCNPILPTCVFDEKERFVFTRVFLILQFSQTPTPLSLPLLPLLSLSSHL